VNSNERWAVPPAKEAVRQLELHMNNGWTERYGNAHIAEAIACSENANAGRAWR
jgi:hypothetical protein